MWLAFKILAICKDPKYSTSTRHNVDFIQTEPQRDEGFSITNDMKDLSLHI